MTMIPAQSSSAVAALELVQQIQSDFAHRLCLKNQIPFKRISWLRDGGRHGGGSRLTDAAAVFYNRASLNVSQVHYDDQPTKPLGSATALSCIVHPDHPLLPSLHMHISWTEMKTGTGYWRLMADLNPAIPDEADRVLFEKTLRGCTGNLFETGKSQGETYFYIPALRRHRGISHFYLEQHQSPDADTDRELAQNFGNSVTRCYGDLLGDKQLPEGTPTSEQKSSQLAYHTLYLFQVLTLDRGTTSGLLVHDQNDLGILASLPAQIDPELLISWIPLMEKPRDELLRAIVDAIPANGSIGDTQKILLCQVVRQFYKKYPQCLDQQAKGFTVPRTVANHT